METPSQSQKKPQAKITKAGIFVVGLLVGVLAFLVIFVIIFGAWAATSTSSFRAAKQKFFATGIHPLTGLKIDITTPAMPDSFWKTIFPLELFGHRFTCSPHYFFLIDENGFLWSKKKSETSVSDREGWTILLWKNFESSVLELVHVDHASIVVLDNLGTIHYGKLTRDKRSKVNAKDYSFQDMSKDPQWWNSWYLSFPLFEYMCPKLKIKQTHKTLTAYLKTQNNKGLHRKQIKNLHWNYAKFLNHDQQVLLSLSNENAYKFCRDVEHVPNDFHEPEDRQNYIHHYFDQTTTMYYHKIGSKKMLVGDPFSFFWFPIGLPFTYDIKTCNIAISSSNSLFCFWIKQGTNLTLWYRFLDMFHLGYARHAILKKKVPSHWFRKEIQLPDDFERNLYFAKTMLLNHCHYTTSFHLIATDGTHSQRILDMENWKLVK